MEEKLNPSVETAYNYLLKGITSFRIAPGQTVSDSQLAKELGISRSPVRDAITLLRNDGLIEIKDGKTVAAGLTMGDVSDILRLRIAIESEALRIIAENGWLDTKQKQTLYELHKEIVDYSENGMLSEHYDADDGFHMTLISFSGSRRFMIIAKQLRLQMQRVRWLNRAVPERCAETVDEHKALLEAIFNQDLDAAENALRNHLSNSEQSFRKVMSDENTIMLAKLIQNLTA